MLRCMDRFRRACLSLRVAMNFLSLPGLFLSRGTSSSARARETHSRVPIRVHVLLRAKQWAIVFFQIRSAYSAPRRRRLSRDAKPRRCHAPLNIATRPRYASVTFLHRRKFALRIMMNAPRSGEETRSSHVKRNITDLSRRQFFYFPSRRSTRDRLRRFSDARYSYSLP